MVHDVVTYLKREKATAKNIKSDQTRHEVEKNLERCIQRLKHVDKGGFALFSGGEHLYEIEGEYPWYYRCSKMFQTNLIVLKTKKLVGIISMDLNDCAFALSSNPISSLKNLTSGIPSKHRAGGQSSQRFKHIREEAKRNWFKIIAAYAKVFFLDNKKVENIIIHGESFTKRDFLKSNLLEYRLQKISTLSDGCYAGEDGLYEYNNSN